MKSVLCFIILLSTICTFHLCDSLILVKIIHPVSHYRKTMEKGLLASDPFNDLDLLGRKQLCRDVALAKQFAGRSFQAAHNEEKFRTSMSVRAAITLNKWNITDENLKNYKPSMYTDLRIRLYSDNRRVIKGLRCRHSNKIEFFLTYGGKPGCSYLLEPSKNNFPRPNEFLVTGIIEPSATLENKNLEYLSNQLETAREAMMSVCGLAMNDKLRLCAAVYDALSSSGLLNISQQNYLRTGLHCVKKTVILEHEGARVMHILPCANVHDRALSNKHIVASLYVLADVRESSAVFVFTPEKGSKVQLLARVTNIAALLHPIEQERKPKGLMKNVNSNDEGESSSYRRKHQIGIKRKELGPDEVYEQHIHDREERRLKRRQEALEDGAKNKESANKDELRQEKSERKEELEDYYDSMETMSEEDEDIESKDSGELKEGFNEETDTEKYESDEIEVTKKKKHNKEEGPTTKTEAYTRDVRSNKSGMILRPRERKKDISLNRKENIKGKNPMYVDNEQIERMRPPIVTKTFRGKERMEQQPILSLKRKKDQENMDRSYKSDEEEEKQEAKTDYNDEEYIPTSDSEEISEHDEYQESSPDGDESIHDWESQTDEETHDEASEKAKNSEEGTDTEKDEENYAKQRKGKEPVRVANIHRRYGDRLKELKRKDIQREREPVFENKNEKEGPRPTTASKTYRGDSRPKHSSLGLMRKRVEEDEDDDLLNVNKNSEIQRSSKGRKTYRGDSPPNHSTVGSSKPRS